MATLKIIPEYSLFCDLIRREDSGKMLFVGVYTQGLSVASFPQNIAFMVYLHGRFVGDGATHFNFRIIYEESAKEFFSAELISNPLLNIAPDLKFELNTPLIMCPVSKPETLMAQIKCEDGDWETFGSLKISLGQVPLAFPTAPPPSV